MFQSIRDLIIAICTGLTQAVSFLMSALSNTTESLDALSEYGLQESQLIRDRGKVKNAQEIAELSKSLEKI